MKKKKQIALYSKHMKRVDTFQMSFAVCTETIACGCSVKQTSVVV